MAESQGFYEQMRGVLRERLLDAAVVLICTDGWSAVTMGRVADAVGISRQSVYKEIGSKIALGEAVVARETETVLAGVIGELRAYGTDAASGIPAAAEYVLRTGTDNPLVKAILVGAAGGDELLQLLAVRPDAVLGRAIAVVRDEARARYGTLGLTADTLDQLSEIVVRLTLSHLMQPTSPIEQAVAQVRTLIQAALAAASTR